MSSRPLVSHAYAAAWRLAGPAARLVFARRAARGLEDAERLPERFGRAARPRPAGPLLWLHAASRGEAVAARALVRGLREDGWTGHVLLSTVSRNGASMADDLPGVTHQYLPLDGRPWIGRFLDHWRPDAAVVLVMDVWPTMVWEADRRGIPLALASAQLSERSLRRWTTWGGRATRDLFGRFRLVLATDDAQRGRLQRLGAGPVETVGCLKAAAEPLAVDEDLLAAARRAAAGRPIVALASTHDGEDAALCDAVAGACPEALVVVAPRYPRDGPRLAGDSAPRWSLGEVPAATDGRWVVDRMGVLGALYEAADVAVIGGSFVPRGGHNPAEAARLGCPSVVGPDMSNQAEVTAELEAAGALVRATDPEAAADAVAALLRDDARRAAAGAAARDTAAGWTERRGVAARRLRAALAL